MTERTEPEDLAEPGRRLWVSVTDEYELAEHEAALLLEACRTADLLDTLAAAVSDDGPMADGKLSPAVVEARQQRLVLARLLAALRMPEGDDDAARPQRRGRPRGVYSVGRGAV